MSSTTIEFQSLENRRKARKNQAKQTLQMRRFSGLTALDKLYLEFVNEYNIGHNPVQWFLNRRLPLLTDKNDRQNEIPLFLDSFTGILQQRNFGHLSIADQVYIKALKEKLDADSPNLDDLTRSVIEKKNFPIAQWFINEFRKHLEHEPKYGALQYWENTQTYLDGLTELLQLEITNTPGSSMASINRQYVDYLQSVLSEGLILANSKAPADQTTKERLSTLNKDLRIALRDDFYHNLQRGTHEEPDQYSCLTTLIKARKTELNNTAKDISTILNENEPNQLNTDAGKHFAEIVKHLKQLNATAALDSLQVLRDLLDASYSEQVATAAVEAFQGLRDPLYTSHLEQIETILDASYLEQITEALYTHFTKIQDMYYEQIFVYYEDTLTKLLQSDSAQNGVSCENSDKIKRHFNQYCNDILFEQPIKKELYDDLIKEHGPKFLGQVWHSVRFELKPALEAQKRKAVVELKHLKKHISHFVQAMGSQTRLHKNKEPETFTDPSEFFTQRYTLQEINDTTPFHLIDIAKQNKRHLNKRFYSRGDLLAWLVGVAEGTIGLVVFGAAMPFMALTVIGGAIVGLAGMLLNHFLLKLDSIGLAKALGMNKFSRYDNNAPLEWYKGLLNRLSMFCSFFGPGVVFACVFLTEFTQLAHQFSPTLHLLAWCIAPVFAFAEWYGIGALLHMANNNLIKNGLSDLWHDIKDFFYRRFYVAFDYKTDSIYHAILNLGELLKQLPRLLVSLVTTVTALGVMAYYLKMTYVFFAATVTALLANYLAHYGLSLVTCVLLGKVAAGMNAGASFMSFTVPLGKMIISVIDLVIKAAVLLPTMAVALAGALFALPYGLYTKTPETHVTTVVQDYFSAAVDQAVATFAWLTSTSVLVEGGLAWSMNKNTPQAQLNFSSSAAWLVYCFLLLANAAGQGFLFLAGVFAPQRVLQASIQFFRSFAMNLQGVLNNVSREQGKLKLTESEQGVFREQQRESSTHEVKDDDRATKAEIELALGQGKTRYAPRYN